MTLNNMQLIFLDIESTGFDCNQDRIIEIGVVKWENGIIIDRFSSLANPHVQIPQEIIQLTGITDTEVAAAPDFSQIKEELATFIGDLPIVGHNIQFDVGFLKANQLALTHNQLIDTVDLARILLVKEASYSLEVLMKKYVPVQRTSHRALADTETTVDFFMFLVERIEALPEKVRTQLNEVLAKSSWPAGVVFEYARENLAVPPLSPLDLPPPQAALSKWQTYWSNDTLELTSLHNRMLVSSAGDPPLNKLTTPLCVAYAYRSTRERLEEQSQAAGLTIAHLKEPGYYLAPRKLAILLSQEKLPLTEVPFLLKMIIWSGVTLTGDREEVSLDRGEYALFDKVADSEAQDFFWQQQVKRADESEIIFVHHISWWKNVHTHLSTLNERTLIISDAHCLEETGTMALSTVFTGAQLQAELGEKGDILTGLLGIFYTRNKPQDDAFGSECVPVDEYTRNSKEWRAVEDAVTGIEHEAFRNKLQKAFTLEDNDIAYIQHFADELSFHKSPLSLKTAFTQSSATWPRIIIHDHTLLLDGLGILDESWHRIDENSNIRDHIEIKVLDDFPEANALGYFKRSMELFSDIIEERRGGCLFIVSSKKAAAAYYRALKSFCESRDVHLYAAGTSGGSGKTATLFLHDPDHSVLFLTPHSLPQHLDVIRHINTMAFQKIPFDPPSDPVVSARSNLCENAFDQYSLPRAIMKLRHILWQFARLSHAPQKTCYLMDSRLTTRSYGKHFI